MVAFLHQYQRPLKTLRLKHSSSLLEYIEVTLEDIDLANKLAVKIFGVSLDDLPVQTRTFLEKLYSYVKEQCKKQEIQDKQTFVFADGNYAKQPRPA